MFDVRVRAGLLGRILSHCNRHLTNKAPMTTGSRWLHTRRAAWRTVIRTLSRVGPEALPRSMAACLLAVACGVGALLATPPAHAVHAIAQYGEPKYPADFKHFDYVNPDAPKGG